MHERILNIYITSLHHLYHA